MDQQNIREYNGQRYSPTEGAAIIKQLDDRTRYDQSGYNSVAEIGSKVKTLVENPLEGTERYATLAEVNALENKTTTIQYLVDSDGDNNGFYTWDGTSATVDFNRDLGVDINDVSEKYDDRVFNEGSEVTSYDRPDLSTILGDVIEIDDNSNLITAKNKLVRENIFDRPDLEVGHIDDNGNVISAQSKLNQKDTFSQFVLTPDYTTGMPTQTNDSVALYNDFDTLRTSQPTNPSFPDYITKTLASVSSVGNYDIYRWDFKPLNPKKTIIITGADHGSERVFTYVFKDMFQYFLEKSNDGGIMEWVRNNVHMVVLPLTSPFGFETGNRRNYETEPFECNWTRSGTTVTITINPATFPSTEILSPENYINETAVDKINVSLLNSSSETAIPNDGYRVKSVVDQYSFTIEGLDAGATSGTIDMFVQTDMNRNYPIKLPNWDTYASSEVNTPYPQDIVGAPNDNKGTKPFSLRESKMMGDILEEFPDAAAIIAFHNGSGRFNLYKNHLVDETDIDSMQYKMAQYTSDPFTYLKSDTFPNLPAYTYEKYGMPGFNPEMGSYVTGSIEQRTAAVRWGLNLILTIARNF